jgi:hypothetical protein
MAEGSDLSAIAFYTQVFTSRLKAERRNKRNTCVGEKGRQSVVITLPFI